MTCSIAFDVFEFCIARKKKVGRLFMGLLSFIMFDIIVPLNFMYILFSLRNHKCIGMESMDLYRPFVIFFTTPVKCLSLKHKD